MSAAAGRRVVVATGNPGKVREFERALGAAGFEVLGLRDLGELIPIEETGATFEDNARQKAEAYSLRTHEVVLAEDSGLEVDALGGEPGVHSARFGGPRLDDEGRVALLLARLAGVEEARRTARFRAVLAVAYNGRALAVFEGVVEGRIALEPRGSGGFGYDPVFFHPPSGCTTAELTVEQKQAISHRGRAIAEFLEAVHRRDAWVGRVGW